MVNHLDFPLSILFGTITPSWHAQIDMKVIMVKPAIAIIMIIPNKHFFKLKNTNIF